MHCILHLLALVCVELCVFVCSLSDSLLGFISAYSVCSCVEPQPVSIGSPPGFRSLNLIRM